ncbi:hypothetical protein [Actinorugispora endophytica]|uniref:Uncharacterized protein n=1 Tax=Actinorugispora endophytica TaxID=1605990 RepID=A0A4V3D964_9ACTN|nr:hypothetical protein [Actinorugispora endophytica]TDQ54890.1 hypothetical protein EV190_101209 [Actinorugispora endophytica]
MAPPASKTVTRIALGLASAGAVVALSGCGLLFPQRLLPPQEQPPLDVETTDAAESADPAGLGLRTGPIPAEMPEFDEGELPPEPTEGTPDEQIEWEILSTASSYVGSFDPASYADCPATNADTDETITCTSLVYGQSSTWTVDVTGGEYVFSYEYAADMVPLSREFTEESLRWQADSEAVACDMDEYQLGSVGESGITCEADDGYGGVTVYDLETSVYGGLSFYGRY